MAESDLDNGQLFKRFGRVTVYSMTQPLYPEEYESKEADIGVSIEDLRFQFEIEHNLKKYPNSCAIRITNLNEESRSVFKKKPLKIVLEAGYRDKFATIYTGDVTFAMSTLDGPNWTTLIQCGDGDRVFSGARTNKSYPPGTPMATIAADVLRSIGVKTPSNILGKPEFQKPRGGYVASGPVKNILSDIAQTCGHTWYIQDGQIKFLQEDEVEGTTFILSEENGMIGSPEFGQPKRNGKIPEITVRSLLYPQLRPGHPVEIRSREVNGTFKIKEVRHKGDTHGTDWITEINIKPVNWSPDDDKVKRGRGAKK